MFDLVFRTTNKAKFAHLDYAIREYDINLKTVGEYGKPYTEPRINDRGELLKESMLDSLIRALKRSSKIGEEELYSPNDDCLFDDNITGNFLLDSPRIKQLVRNYRGTPFIIEDTSVVIDAFSTSENEVPGLDIKYWMQDMTFLKLDEMLKRRGSNRRAKVRSDIVLLLPKSKLEKDSTLFMYFYGESEGSVAETEFEFKTNPVYPWLDNKTFNKWFIPEGESYPISMLNIEKATLYDFRIKAANKLIEYLVSNQKVKSKKSLKNLEYQKQFPLFSQPTYIVSGPTCAGKTILARHIAHKYSYYHIEASDFMHLKYYQLHGNNTDITIHEFASEILKVDPYVVAKMLVSFVSNLKSLPVVITGFRAREEIDFFLKHHTGESIVSLLYVESSQKIRYQRNLNRLREDALSELKKFKERDALQHAMGLKRIKSSLISLIINESSIRDYYSEFDDNFSNNDQFHFYRHKKYFIQSISSDLKLEQAILLTLLNDKGKVFFTTPEITKLANLYFGSVRKKISGSNVGRYFNMKYHPYYEISRKNNRNSYRLSQTGRSEALKQESILNR